MVDRWRYAVYIRQSILYKCLFWRRKKVRSMCFSLVVVVVMVIFMFSEQVENSLKLMCIRTLVYFHTGIIMHEKLTSVFTEDKSREILIKLQSTKSSWTEEINNGYEYKKIIKITSIHTLDIASSSVMEDECWCQKVSNCCCWLIFRKPLNVSSLGLPFLVMNTIYSSSCFTESLLKFDLGSYSTNIY